jgi:hypothetical protein
LIACAYDDGGPSLRSGSSTMMQANAMTGKTSSRGTTARRSFIIGSVEVRPETILQRNQSNT